MASAGLLVDEGIRSMGVEEGLQGSPVGEAVGELLEELVAGEVCDHHPLAHGQGLCGGGGHHVAGGGVDENPIAVE